MAVISLAASQCVVALLPKLWASGVCRPEGATQPEIKLLLARLLILLSRGPHCIISQLCLSIRQPLHTHVSDQTHMCNLSLVEVSFFQWLANSSVPVS